MKFRFFILCSVLTLASYAQEKEFNSAIVKINKYIEGSLVTPYSEEEAPLIIFVMDAGAINRDGNDRMSKNDTFKKLSYGLAKLGIASYRYDKRLFKMDRLGIKEQEVTLDHFISDTKTVIDYFSKNGKYPKIVVVGHGQGSLVGMIASKDNPDDLTDNPVDGFISISGNAQSIDQVIIEQISKQAPGLDKRAAVAFKQLRDTGRAINYDPALESIFRYNLQPFMKSWMKYNPSEAIAALDIPTLIIHGDKDIQVATSEAEKLKESAPQADYLLIENMNHILREIKGNRMENHKSYNESWREIMPEILQGIATFVNEHTIEKN